MRIGIDIDNTITNTTETILIYAKEYSKSNNINITVNSHKYFIEESLGWNRKHAENFLEHYLTDIYTNVSPKPDSIEVIRHLHQNHSIVLITSRNEKFPFIKETTHEWLSKHEISYDKLVMNDTEDLHHFSKLDACLKNNIDIMVEDHHDLAVEISAKIPVLLFDYPYNTHVQKENIFRVNKWLEVKKFIEGF